MPTALAQLPLPSARNSMPSPPEAFFQASITNTSFTPVTATVLIPLALIAARFFTKPGRWFLWQVGVNAPGTANSTTFLPLNNSSVVIGFGPSPVITVKLPLGTLSPTLIAMIRVLSQGYGIDYGRQVSASGELVETVSGLNGFAARDGGQPQRGAFATLAGRQSVEDEGKSLQTRRRTRDRLRQGERPLRGRAFGEQHRRRA